MNCGIRLSRENENMRIQQFPMKNDFSMQTYKEFVQRCAVVELEASNDFHFGLDQMKILRKEYRSRLPIYLLARCPICGGRVHEPIDTYSLNGIGWRRPNRGFGWYGTVPVVSQGTAPESDVSYDAECKHAKIVSVMVNLNGIQPDDVTQEAWVGSERPFVMPPILNLEKTFAVIHALPIGRFDDVAPQHHYTAYIVTYFTHVDGHLFDKVMQPAYEEHGLILIDWADYDLMKWVHKGKLYWLDKKGSTLSLRNQPASDFPYAGVRGGEGIWVIRNGKMELRYGKNRQWSGGELEPEWDMSGGFFRQLVSAFKAGMRDRKK